jgi:osmotically-inducible protein OsmY
MRHITIASATAVTLFLAGGQASVQAQSATETIERKTDEAASKARSLARDASTEITDSWLTAMSKLALFGDERVRERQISVETNDSVVTLRGTVSAEEEKAAAAEIVARVDNVKGVRNELQVVSAERSSVDTDVHQSMNGIRGDARTRDDG